MGVRYRSAVTGRWVSAEYAKANPDTTVAEDTRPPKQEDD